MFQIQTRTCWGYPEKITTADEPLSLTSRSIGARWIAFIRLIGLSFTFKCWFRTEKFRQPCHNNDVSNPGSDVPTKSPKDWKTFSRLTGYYLPKSPMWSVNISRRFPLKLPVNLKRLRSNLTRNAFLFSYLVWASDTPKERRNMTFEVSHISKK